MDPMRELPLGFGMALCANQAAADVFARMTPQRQQEIVAGTHAIRSSKEMRASVAGLAETEGL